VASMFVLPILAGIIIVGMLVMSSRGRSAGATQAPAPTPAPVATVAPTPMPTPAIPAALTQPPASTKLMVSNVGTDGLSLRKAPGSGDRIKVWREGTEMVDLGQRTDLNGKSWRQVRDPDGSVGWAAADFLKDPAQGPAGGPPIPTYQSGGLGLSRQAWEQTHGQPSRVSIFLEYDGGQLIVGLSNNNIWHLERIWAPRDAVELDVARDEARTYLPADATLNQTIDKGDGRLVDIYTSPSLTSQFGPTAWNGGKQGMFLIQYRFRSGDDRHVTSAMFRLGDVLF